MDARTVTVRMLLAVLLLGVATPWLTAPLFANDPEAKADAPATSEKKESESRHEIILYYFHGTRRCNTCRTIEAYAKEAVEGRYAAQLKSGRLTWKVINIDKPDNEHFIEDFGLVSSSLVLVEVKGDQVARHQVLQGAWTLVRDKARFIEYVQRSVGEYLKS